MVKLARVGEVLVGFPQCRTKASQSPFAAISLLVAPISGAAPHALTGDQRAAFRAAFREGRRLAGEQQWTQAAVRLEAALAILPLDVHVRCETGYAQLRAGNAVAAAAHMQIVQRLLPAHVLLPRGIHSFDVQRPGRHE